MKGLMVFAAASLCAAPAWASGPTPQSSADAFVAKITSAGVSTKAGPFASVSASGKKFYSNSATGTPENDVISLLPLNPTPSLYLNLGAVKANASNTGVQGSNEAWQGSAEVDSVQASINLKPLPPSGPFPQPFLNIVAKKVSAKAGLNVTFPSTENAVGGAKIGHLEISGSALTASVHFNGSPAPNTVIYDSPTVTITLNAQTQSGLISCSPAPGTCTFTPYSIETDAVDIELHKAPWQGKKYSGHIVIGRATAGQ